MVDFPTYFGRTDVVSGKRLTQRPGRKDTDGAAGADGETNAATDRVVLQFPARGKLAASATAVPSAEEANQALDELCRQLPSTTQDLGDIHQFPDRRRIIDLLTPLVD